jgi:tetratricopeptide (TPR) repeat protein
MKSEHHLPLEKIFPLDEQLGPARIGMREARTLVERALDTWQSETAQAPRRRKTKMLLLAAAVFAIASSAAGLFYAQTISKQTHVSDRPTTPRLSAPKPAKQPEAPAIDQQTESSAELPASIDHTVQRTKDHAPQKQADDLLQIANKQRQQERWREAEQTYRRVYMLYPNSSSAYVAAIAAASIRLERLNNPRGALSLYTEAMSVEPNGSLDIEARLGIARSWQALGDRKHEIETLRALLRKYSSGPMVQRARERLEVVSGGN